MNWFILQIINFISDQIYITAGISGSKFIVPDGVKIEAAAFRLDTNSGNISWYPLKSEVDLDVNN